MTPELRKYYEDRFSMMASKGWVDLIEDIEKMISSTNKLDSVDEDHSIDYRRGELSIMNWLKNLKELSLVSFEELKNEDVE